MDRRTFTKIAASLTASTLFANDEVTPKKSVEIFLTVDDGWSQKERILEVANHYKVPLNLFIIGKVIEKDPKFWQDAIEKGHLLGCHTQNHPRLSKVDEKTIISDFKSYKESIINNLGRENFEKIKFFRYPYGDIGKGETKEVAKSLVADSGWKISWWNIDLSFISTIHGVKAFTDPYEQLDFFKKNIKSINVPLFHFKDPDAKAIELIIEYGVEKGYKFSRLDSAPYFL